MRLIEKNNQVYISGKIVSEFTFSHEVFGEGFYQTVLCVSRTSGNKDLIPLIISERLMDVIAFHRDDVIHVTGQFRSNNEVIAGRRKLRLYVFALEVTVPEDTGTCVDTNEIVLNGYLCKSPAYRQTPQGRHITDMLLAVNRAYGKSDYIPCIVWGRNAWYASELEVGTRVQLHGRIQSREYVKKLGEHEETRTAYEVSVSKIGRVDNV